jgi:uncharacterized protein DUF6326
MSLKMNKAGTFEDMHINVKFKLSALWVSVMLCYIYGDYFGLYKPGTLQSMLDGQMGPLGHVTQTVLVGTSILMAIPALMVFLSLALKANLNRLLNMIFGMVYTIIILITMPGAWTFYIVLGVIEAFLTLLIFWNALKWPTMDT